MEAQKQKWWKRNDPSDKDAVRLEETLLRQAELKPSNVLDMTKRISRPNKKPALTVVKDEE
jgi:hypothetical protein